MTAIILAAGFSKRFGRKKLLMNINNKPMIMHVIDLVLKMCFEQNILVYQYEEIKKLAAGRNIKCVFNAASVDGLSSSVKCGIRNAGLTDAYIFFMGDQPFIDEQTVNLLLAGFYEKKESIVVPVYGGQRGNPVIFDCSWKSELESMTGDVGGRKIIQTNTDKVHFVKISDQRAGMDIDTWEDYNSLCKELNKYD